MKEKSRAEKLIEAVKRLELDELSFQLKKAEDKASRNEFKFALHIVKLLAYGNSTGDAMGWSREIYAWLDDIQGMTLKGSHKKLSKEIYLDNFFDPHMESKEETEIFIKREVSDFQKSDDYPEPTSTLSYQQMWQQYRRFVESIIDKIVLGSLERAETYDLLHKMYNGGLK